MIRKYHKWEPQTGIFNLIVFLYMPKLKKSTWYISIFWTLSMCPCVIANANFSAWNALCLILKCLNPIRLSRYHSNAKLSLNLYLMTMVYNKDCFWSFPRPVSGTEFQKPLEFLSDQCASLMLMRRHTVAPRETQDGGWSPQRLTTC